MCICYTDPCMDKLFEKATVVLGSTAVIGISLSWCVYAYISGNREFLDVVSMVTFLFGELILRGQNVQSRRFELLMRKDFAATKRIEKKL